ncbi:hypothetical protein [Thioalkalivibrio sp. ALE16]|uniref:hypothetical protein n=1 Tax=Thioalkalivibrio sp. ALE16 TaxID=1158172 RepID=UPI0012DEB6E1|nr:hypothetical protein [Thioalkalivibrio sp. ALE16]
MAVEQTQPEIRAAVPERGSIPKSALVSTIQGSERDVKRYAESWLRERGSVQGFWCARPWGEGVFLVEVHDGGGGKGWLDPLIALYRESGEGQGVIPGSESSLIVELGDTAARTLAVAPGDAPGTILRPTGSMNCVDPKPEVPLLLMTGGAMFLGALLLLLAIAHRPVPDPISILPPADTAIWSVWSHQVVPLNGGDVETLRYEDGEWTWSPASN